MFWLSLTFAAATLFGAHASIFPPPKSLHITGDSVSFSSRFQISKDFYNRATPRLDYTIGQHLTHPNEPSTLHLLLDHPHSSPTVEQHPSLYTNYSYQLLFKNGTATATASTQYGLMYAIESFTQLVEATGQLPGSDIEINDSPQYAWRGLMIDTGRRFVPLPAIKNLLDTMAAVKLNVLHLHASDMCRFSVESKLYPNLTQSLTGIYGGFYTQKDIQDMIEYASNRGIRVVPEFDVPGHARNMRAIESQGVEFCKSNDPQVNQLFNDPANNTFNAVHSLLKEMSSLFVDDVFNIGCDETAVVDRCTLNSTFQFERNLFQAVHRDFQKTPSGWEEAAFDAGAATSDTIVDGWSHHLAAEIIAKGWRAIESHEQAFYMTAAVPGGPEGWKKMWYDISTNVPASNISRLLGGEISMWTDTYCTTDQCGAFAGAVPVGSALFPPAMDVEFATSLGGMIWPRGFVGSAAFWNFNASVNVSSSSYVDSIWALNDKLAKRGSRVCPTKCSCDQLSACGKPYIS